MIATNLPLLRHCLIERVLRVGGSQQCLYAEQDGAYLQSWRPIILQYVKTDAAETVDVGVVDASEETYSGRAHGIVVWEEQFQLKNSTCNSAWSAHDTSDLLPCALTLVAAATRTFHYHVEIAHVIIMRYS